MTPEFIDPNYGAEHTHVSGTVNGMIGPYAPNGFTGPQAAMDLYFDFPRFLGGIDSDGLQTTSWDTLDDDFTILLAVLDSIGRRRTEGFNVRVRKLELEGSEGASIGEPDVCVIVKFTRGGREFLADHEDGSPIEGLEPMDIVNLPESEDPPPRPPTRRHRTFWDNEIESHTSGVNT